MLESINESPLETDKQLEVTVPARALRELQRMLNHSTLEETVSLYLDEGQIVFAWQNQRLTTRTLEGQYPVSYTHLTLPTKA